MEVELPNPLDPQSLLPNSTILDVRSLLPQPSEPVPSEFEVDIGNLLVFDYQEQKIQSQMELTRRSIQELFEHVFVLPVKPSNLGPIATLTPPTTLIPREKPLPKAKPETRWEKFAKEKGIKKKKRGRLVWDEATQEWRPRWGMNRVNDTSATWLMEDKPNQQAKYKAEDPFHLEILKKKERIEKNKKSMVKNDRRILGEQDKLLPATIDITKNAPMRQKYSIERAVALAQKSTASMGKFDELHPDEPKIKGKSTNNPTRDNQTALSKIADRAIKKSKSEPTLNIEKAVRQEIGEEQTKKKRKINKESSKKHQPKKRRKSK